MKAEASFRQVQRRNEAQEEVREIEILWMRIQLIAGFEMEERFNEIEYGGNLTWEDKKKPWLTARKKMGTLVLQPNWTGFWPKNSAWALKWICLQSLQ